MRRDVSSTVAYYRREGGVRLANRFLDDLHARLLEIGEHPTRFPFYLGKKVMRRATLGKFPQIILFRILPDSVRVSVVKHEKRHPNYGLWRS